MKNPAVMAIAAAHKKSAAAVALKYIVQSGHPFVTASGVTDYDSAQQPSPLPPPPPWSTAPMSDLWMRPMRPVADVTTAAFRSVPRGGPRAVRLEPDRR